MILYHLIQLIAAGGVCSWEIPPKCDSVALARFPEIHYCPCAQECFSSMYEWLPTGGPHLGGHEMLW